jgi:hypothetical protein
MEKVLLGELEKKRACDGITSPAMREDLAAVCGEVEAPGCVTTASGGFPQEFLPVPLAPSGTPCSFPFRVPDSDQVFTKCFSDSGPAPMCVTDTDEGGQITQIGFCDLNKCEVDWGVM